MTARAASSTNIAWWHRFSAPTTLPTAEVAGPIDPSERILLRRHLSFASAPGWNLDTFRPAIAGFYFTAVAEFSAATNS